VKAVGVRVHGRVQGVWYRGTTWTEAQRLGLAGWVRNRSDGTVEAHFQGDPVAVEAMLAWCRVGPPGARVTQLDVEDAERDGTLADFQIR
jgi:acylphosphatase